MAIFEIVPDLFFASRSEWVTNTSLPRLGHIVPRQARTHVFVHHTVTPDGDETPNEWESKDRVFARMRSLQTIRPDLGLDVPYNFVAFLFGDSKLMICEGRGEDRSGAHTKGHNTPAIAVSFAGNFEDISIAKPALTKRVPLLSNFLGWLKHDPSHPDYGTFDPMERLDSLKPNGRNVWYHSDVKQTACPGKHLEAVLDDVEFAKPS